MGTDSQKQEIMGSHYRPDTTVSAYHHPLELEREPKKPKPHARRRGRKIIKTRSPRP